MDELNRIIKALREWGLGQKVPLVYYGICGNLAHMGASGFAGEGA